MDNNFIKFKKIIIKEAIIKCTLVGLSIGISVFSILFLLDKRDIIDFNLVLCILLGLISVLISFVTMFSIIKPEDIDVAKRIDNAFNMNEKVQTMVSYKDNDGDMVLVQREDTKEKLSSYSNNKFPIKINIIYFISSILAISLLVIALAVPSLNKNKENGNNPNGSFESSEEIIIIDEGTVEWYIDKVEDIIQMVNESNIIESAKLSYIEDLNKLIEDIQNSNNEFNIVQDAAMKAVQQIEIDEDVLNTNNDIHYALEEVSDYNVRTFAQRLNRLEINVLATILDNMCYNLQNSEDPTNPNAEREALEQFQTNFSGRINEKIVINGRISASDPLYVSIKNLCVAVSTIPVDTLNLDAEIESKFIEYAPQIIIEAKKQSDIHIVGVEIVTELSNIFDLIPEVEPDDDVIPEIGGSEELGSNESEESTEEPSELPGGIGDDELILGGNAQIYDPDKGYVDYGEVMEDYFAKIRELIEMGQIGEEFNELIDKYYSLLQMGIPKNNNNNNNE